MCHTAIAIRITVFTLAKIECAAIVRGGKIGKKHVRIRVFQLFKIVIVFFFDERNAQIKGIKMIFTEEKLDFEAIGIQIHRGAERIDVAPLPDVFTNIPAAEYELLAPLSAKAFVVEDMRKMRYLEPERFTDCTQDVWDGYFFSEEPDGYFKGAHMDFGIIVPFSEKAEEGLWQQSKLEKVKAYILRQLEEDI